MLWQISFLPAQLGLPEALAPETQPSLACPPKREDRGGHRRWELMPITLHPKCHTSKGQAQELPSASLQHPPWARYPTGAMEMDRNVPL